MRNAQFQAALAEVCRTSGRRILLVFNRYEHAREGFHRLSLIAEHYSLKSRSSFADLVMHINGGWIRCVSCHRGTDIDRFRGLEVDAIEYDELAKVDLSPHIRLRR